MVAGAWLSTVLICLISPLRLEAPLVDGLTEVRLDAAVLCRPRCGRCHGAIAGTLEHVSACSRVSSLPRLWWCSPETPSVGFADANP
jgi:hypothetical protein